MAQKYPYDKLVESIDEYLKNKESTLYDVAYNVVGAMLVFEAKNGSDSIFGDELLSKLFDVAANMEWQPEVYDNKIEAMIQPFEEFKKRIESKQAKPADKRSSCDEPSDQSTD